MNRIIVLGDTPEIPKEYWFGNVNQNGQRLRLMKTPWAEHYKHCEQCKKAIEIRLLEATDIYDPVGGRKMLRNCCDEGRRLCIEATPKDDDDDDASIIY
jgi:hypothetical protein